MLSYYARVLSPLPLKSPPLLSHFLLGPRFIPLRHEWSHLLSNWKFQSSFFLKYCTGLTFSHLQPLPFVFILVLPIWLLYIPWVNEWSKKGLWNSWEGLIKLYFHFYLWMCPLPLKEDFEHWISAEGFSIFRSGNYETSICSWIKCHSFTQKGQVFAFTKAAEPQYKKNSAMLNSSALCWMLWYDVQWQLCDMCCWTNNYDNSNKFVNQT